MAGLIERRSELP